MDALLYGHNAQENVVAVQHTADGTMRVYTRAPDGVTSASLDFYPFFFLSDSSFLKGFPSKHWVKELGGNNYYRFLCAFTSWPEMWEAVHYLIERYNSSLSQTIETYSDLPILLLKPDAVSQFLMQSGMTLFKSMDFHDLYRLQLDIETYTSAGFKFSNADRADDRIILIALSDNRGWNYVIDGKKKPEREMLAELIHLINEKDPDVIEGHNIYNFDLPYILKRCDLSGIEFKVGRDGSVPRSFDSRTMFAERLIDYSKHEIAGRHIIDTWLLLQSYDASKRTLESYGLKQAAQHFGFAKQDRIYIKSDRISWYWDHEPDLLMRYALDDVDETRQLSEMLSPSAFYLTQMLPFNYGTAASIGSSAKIESLLLREYLRARQSIPKPDTGIQTSGGYTDIFSTGVLGPIVDVDVESLYPSIMLSEKIIPRSESLGIFLPLLEDLTRQRFDAKRMMKASTDTVTRARYDALQSSFKILINSFYGYLGYNRALFSDSVAADQVTISGQKILRALISSITSNGGKAIEVDTDGIFFVPPANIRTEEQEKTFVEKISTVLPAGINLATKGRHKAILSYKMKNYALLSYDNKITIKGSSLTSRSIESFGRHYIQQCVEALLNNNIARLHQLYIALHRDISDHKLSVSDFARTETLKDSLDEYSQSITNEERNRHAVYEVAITSGMQWKRGDRIAYYITGNDSNVRSFEHGKLADEWDPNFPDENVSFYLKRLDEFSRKFEVFFVPKDFQSIFSTENLFGFSDEGIKILTNTVAGEEGIEEPEFAHGELKIWLDEDEA